MITKKEIIIAFGIAFMISICSALLLNSSAAFIENVLWVNISFMGDAAFAFAAVMFLLFFAEQKELSLRLLLSVIITLIIVQSVKNISFGQPVHLYFEQGRIEKIAAGAGIISSHAAIAFTLAAFISYYYKSNILRAVVFTVAVLVAVSRLYIGGENIFSLALALSPAAISVLLISRMSVRGPRVKRYRTRRAMRFS